MKPLINSNSEREIELFLKSTGNPVCLVGEIGVGKYSAAEYISSIILDTNIDNINNHPEFISFDASSKNTGIESVRELQSRLKTSVPGTAQLRRVVIIKDVDSLRHEAQNALLKLVEEPPLNTQIILTLSNPNNVIPTLFSRTQRINIRPVSLEEAKSYYKDKFSDEEITKSFHISSGQATLMNNLLNNSAHPLITAISKARDILSQPKYVRLAQVDSIIKSKDSDPAILLDAMYRLINASYNQVISLNKTDMTSSTVQRLIILEEAINDLSSNVQPKIVLNRAFTNL